MMQVVSGSRDKSIRVWDVRSGGQAGVIEKAHKSDVSEVTICGDYSIVSVSRDMSMNHFDLRTMKCVKSIQAHTEEIYGVALCADRSRLCTAGKGKVVHTWDLNLNPLAQCHGHTKTITAVVASSTENCIASVSEDGFLRIWVAPS